QIHQAANKFFERVVPGVAVAVGADSFCPLASQMDRLVADGVITRGAIHPRHAAEPLAEYGVAILRTPSAQRLPRREKPGVASIAAEDVVIRNVEIEITGRLELLAPPAVA